MTTRFLFGPRGCLASHPSKSTRYSIKTTWHFV